MLTPHVHAKPLPGTFGLLPLTSGMLVFAAGLLAFALLLLPTPLAVTLSLLLPPVAATGWNTCTIASRGYGVLEEGCLLLMAAASQACEPLR